MDVEASLQCGHSLTYEVVDCIWGFVVYQLSDGCGWVEVYSGEGEVIEYTPCEYGVGWLVYPDVGLLAVVDICIEFYLVFALIH